MSRPKVEINPIAGLRLKELLKEQNMSQLKLSKTIFYSQQTISKVIQGTARLTEAMASRIIEIFPNYYKEWLLGYDYPKNQYELNKQNLYRSIQEGNLLFVALQALAEVNGFSLKFKNNCSDETADIEDIVSKYTSGFILMKEEKSYSISIEEMNVLENKISEYAEFLLNKYIEKGV